MKRALLFFLPLAFVCNLSAQKQYFRRDTTYGVTFRITEGKAIRTTVATESGTLPLNSATWELYDKLTTTLVPGYAVWYFASPQILDDTKYFDAEGCEIPYEDVLLFKKRQKRQ